MASVARYCCCGAASVPCTDCDPGGTGTAPEAADIDGLSGATGCSTIADATYNNFSTPTNTCQWEWWGSDANWASIFRLIYCHTGPQTVGASWCDGSDPGISLAAGEWAVALLVEDIAAPTPYAVWRYEKTTGFSCSASTGKVSGTHTFGANACDTDGTPCDGTPTITVDP